MNYTTETDTDTDTEGDVGSCAGRCHVGASDASCACDADCTDRDYCCPDVCLECQPDFCFDGSCDGFCGQEGDFGGCSCDELCVLRGDCCSNYCGSCPDHQFCADNVNLASVDWSFTDLGYFAGPHGHPTIPDRHNGTLRFYTSDDLANGEPVNPAWSFVNANTVRWDIEGDNECGEYGNDNTQRVYAQAVITLTEAAQLQVVYDGFGELVDSGFEVLQTHLNGECISQSETVEASEDICDMGPIAVAEPVVVFLAPGVHTLELHGTTGDELYHQNAFYEVALIIEIGGSLPVTSPGICSNINGGGDDGGPIGVAKTNAFTRRSRL